MDSETRPLGPSLLASLAAFAVAVVYLAPTLGNFPGFLDVGLVLSAADRILQGDLLYRDIYFYSGPLSAYLFAGWMHVAGVSVLSAQLLLLLIRASCCGVLAWIGSRVMPAPLAVAPALALLLSYAAEPQEFLHHWTMNLVLLLGAAALLAHVERPGPGRALLAGFLAGQALCTLLPFAMPLVVAGAVALVLGPRARLAKDAALYAAGAAVAVGLWLAPFALAGALEPLRQDMFASNVYRAKFEMIRPASVQRIFVATLLGPDSSASQLIVWQVLITLAGLVAPPLRLGRAGPREGRLVKVLYVLSTLTVLVCLGRLMPSQLLLHAFLCYVVVAWAAWRSGRVARTLAALLALLLLEPGSAAYEAAAAARHEVRFPRGTVEVATAGEAAGLAQLVRFLEKETAGTGAAFFIPYEPNLYFLMDLGNPTRFAQMRPLQYSPEQMREAAAALKAHPEVQVFRFPVYESDAFLRLHSPDGDLAAYRAGSEEFMRMLDGYVLDDRGAVQIWKQDPDR